MSYRNVFITHVRMIKCDNMSDENIFNDRRCNESISRQRKPLAPRLRFSILRRDSFTCQYCGLTADGTELHVDHVIPHSKGGSDTPDNLITSCKSCNYGKGATDLISRVSPPSDVVKSAQCVYSGYDLLHPADRGVHTGTTDTCAATLLIFYNMVDSIVETQPTGWALDKCDDSHIIFDDIAFIGVDLLRHLASADSCFPRTATYLYDSDDVHMKVIGRLLVNARRTLNK